VLILLVCLFMIRILGWLALLAGQRRLASLKYLRIRRIAGAGVATCQRSHLTKYDN